MCHIVNHQLICMHTWTEYLYCDKSPGPEQVCGQTTRQDEPYPPRHDWGNLPDVCTMGQSCPFEAKNRHWECCWCHKMGNELGRCGAVFSDDGQRWQCEHICCYDCRAMRPRHK